MGTGTGVSARDACSLDSGGSGSGGVACLNRGKLMRYVPKDFSVLRMRKRQGEVDLQNGKEDHTFDF